MSPKQALAAAVAWALCSPAFATGACPIKDAGPKAEWKEQAALEKKLVASGWQVRRIKVDGQCYEVYGFDAAGKRVEAYFDPRTLEPTAKP
jgi:hypothetical protein